MTAPLRDALGDYLRMRRALGYRLVRPEKLLTQFLDYLDAAGSETVTVEAALMWSCSPTGGNVNWWAYRLSVVRGFALGRAANRCSRMIAATVFSLTRQPASRRSSLIRGEP
jgi:hypothetical protein